MLPLDPARHIVTAVIVTHDGARWLPETLEAVREQSRPVQRVIGVDTGSRDRSGRILADFIAPDAITTLDRSTGFGDAVRAALDLRRARAEFPGAAPDATEWVWLVHDDCTPDPDALQHLLLAANDDPRAAVLGPKLCDWFDRRLLVEAGVTIDGAGRRETGLESREFDHGQHDGTRAVLAVSSAGMLVRRDVWDQLDGFDRALPVFRDDIDFCWRAGSAGHRVLIVTDAVAYHAEAAARRRRRISAAADHPRRLDRRNAIFVLLANLPVGGMLAAFVRNTFASLLRVLMYIAAKQPANAFDEAVAISAVYLMPFRLLRARVRRRRNRKRTYSAIRPFLARGVALRQFTDAVSNLVAGTPGLDTPGRHQAVTAPPRDDEDPLDDDQSMLMRALRSPGVLLVATLAVVTLVAERSLLFGAELSGGALPPVTGGAADLWNLYLTGRPEVGAGAGAPAPPYVGVLALLSTLLLGKPWLAVTVIVLGCVPLAGFTAYLLARRVLDYRPAQVWMAGSYALLPMATGAVAQGRLGTAVVHALLPVLGILLTRLLTLPPRQSRRTAWALALFLAAGTAFVPLLWLLALITGVLVAVAFGHLGRRLYGSLSIALCVPLVLLLPWSAELFLHPSLWLLEAGLHRPELSSPPPSAEQLLMLSPGGPGSPPVWVTAGFLAAALFALLLLRYRMQIAVGWSVALFGILVAIVISRVPVEPWYGGPSAPAWPGVALAFAATAMLLSAATTARSFGVMWSMGGPRRAFVACAAALALTTPVCAAGVWMWNGAQGPLTGQGGPGIPGMLSAVSSDARDARTLVVSPGSEGPVRYAVLRGREPRIGEGQIPAAEGIGDALDATAAGLVAGQGGDQAKELARLGIGYVLMPRPPESDDASTTPVDTLDGVPGVSRVLMTERFGLWRLDEPTGRLQVAGDGEPVVLQRRGEGAYRVPSGSGGRTLVLAEPAGTGWSATLDGEALAAGENRSGLTTFELPAAGGPLRLDKSDPLRWTWLAAQGGLLVMVAVFALPGVRTEEDLREEEAQPAPRPRRPALAGLRGSAGTRSATRGHRARGTRRAGGRGTERAGGADSAGSEGSDQ
ncbi:glycosyltransferase family 2 protein [Streptomonospora wellingtoniae]|uniref:Glycosyltransferase family 2 protein n=1 Tax=Streptomonospora wellingtoniae TaxID=3075544 RepID=A0ABU2KR31_9ACTN|nr:glycosyltransferase family 2 protein [Streptomonospora sp. DSM 45055]MDT0301588.1 glycosyltransferase family 2 protein [Streptomonospora sp. DSM 45055]